MALPEKKLHQLRRTPIGSSGNRLQAAIDLAEETQTSVAAALSLPYTYVSDTARGRYQTITVEKAHKFADYFGCAIEDLFPSREALTA